MDPLKILKESSTTASPPLNEAFSRRQENAARMEREWEQDPEQFNPEKTAIGRLRMKRTWEWLLKTVQLLPAKGADIGCGWGGFAQKLQKEGQQVTVVDVAKKAFHSFDTRPFDVRHEGLPKLSLPDDAFGLVLCTDVIAYLSPLDFRMAMSELSRLLHREGWVACSTPLNIRDDGALEQFIALVETEFEPVVWIYSHHGLYLRVLELLKGAGQYARGARDPSFRKKIWLKKASSFQKRIWQWNTSSPLGLFWRFVALFLNPLAHFWEQSDRWLRWSEILCRFFHKGISHALFIGHRKPLLPAYPKTALPERPPFKKERKWE